MYQTYQKFLETPFWIIYVEDKQQLHFAPWIFVNNRNTQWHSVEMWTHFEIRYIAYLVWNTDEKMFVLEKKLH